MKWGWNVHLACPSSQAGPPLMQGRCICVIWHFSWSFLCWEECVFLSTYMFHFIIYPPSFLPRVLSRWSAVLLPGNIIFSELWTQMKIRPSVSFHCCVLRWVDDVWAKLIQGINRLISARYFLSFSSSSGLLREEIMIKVSWCGALSALVDMRGSGWD